MVPTAAVLLATIITLTGAGSVNAITCDDVRSLSRAEQEYWSKRLGLTAQERRKIIQTCYGNDHRRPKLRQVQSE